MMSGSPRPTSGLIRPRLLDLLGRARLPAPVVAPTGYGKTFMARYAAAAALVRLGRRTAAGLLPPAGTTGVPEHRVRAWPGESPRRPAGAVPEPVVAGPPASSVLVRCFGGFRMEIDGRVVDLSGVRARARMLLRLLAMRAGQPVHREVLTEALWPDLRPAAATRNLQVSVSNLRKLLQPYAAVVRTGDAYALALYADGRADTLAFGAAIDRWRSARRGEDGDAVAAAALREALSVYRGELLPEDGPAEWVIEERERYRRLAASAASALAAIELARGNGAEAVVAAEQCVGTDPYHDTGWRQLLSAYELSGDLAAAATARRRYADVLASLGVPAAFHPRPRVVGP
jgi:DNA-binding SARP family transcriptional activator